MKITDRLHPWVQLRDGVGLHFSDDGHVCTVYRHGQVLGETVRSYPDRPDAVHFDCRRADGAEQGFPRFGVALTWVEIDPKGDGE